MTESHSLSEEKIVQILIRKDFPMKQKQIPSFVLLIIILILISACTEGSASPKNAWHTYENQKHGYSFNYPPDCTNGALSPDCKSGSPEEQKPACLCFLNPENPDRVLMQAYQTNNGKEPVLSEFYIGTLNIPANNLPTDKVLTEDWLAENFPEKWKNSEFEYINIDGVSAVSLATPASSMAPAVKEIYFSHNDQIFQIRMLDPDKEDNNELYERILTSFHFDS